MDREDPEGKPAISMTAPPMQEALRLARAGARRAEPFPPKLPGLCSTVHYVSFGSPGGEYESVCRAATVTGVGAWLPESVGPESVGDDGIRSRAVVEEWHPDACSLTVHNPTGQFFKVVRFHRGDLADEQAVAAGAPALRSYPGGTWHWPCAACNPGDAR